MPLRDLGELPFPFRSEIDRRIALNGPAAVFTLDARGQLQFDGARSRESWDRLEHEMKTATLESCPCLFRDHATGWVQFVFATSVTLCRQHPRADVRIFSSPTAAIKTLQSLGVPPVLSDVESWDVLPGSPA